MLLYMYPVLSHSQIRFIVTMAYWTGFRWQDVTAFAYLVLYVKSCVIWSRQFTSILYISKLSRWWLTRTMLCTNPSWLYRCTCLSVFSSIGLWYFRSDKDSSVNSNFVFLPQLLEGTFLVSMLLRGSARHMSPILTFLDLPFRAFSRIALWGVKIWSYKICFPTWSPKWMEHVLWHIQDQQP